MANFAALLNKRAEDITAPKPLPTGTWTFKVTLKAGKPRDEDDDGYVQGIFTPVEPLVDVDSDALAAFGDFEGEKVFQRFWLRDKRDEWRLKEFCTTVGVDPAGKSFGEMIGEVTDYLVNAVVEHDVDKNDPEKVYNRLSKFASAA